jgi:alanine racemase
MVGAISMDGLVVDVSDIGSVGLDDEFVLIGRQGSHEISAEEVAEQRGTINYEVTTMLRGRLPRRHGRP